MNLKHFFKVNCLIFTCTNIYTVYILHATLQYSHAILQFRLIGYILLATLQTLRNVGCKKINAHLEIQYSLNTVTLYIYTSG